MSRKRNANIKRLSWVLAAVTIINLCLSGSVSAMEGWPQLVRQELTGGGSMGTEVTDGLEGADTTDGQEEPESTNNQEEPETTGGQGESESADNQEEPESDRKSVV